MVATLHHRRHRAVLYNFLGHVVGVSHKVGLEVGVEVLWHVVEVVFLVPVLFICPHLAKLVLRVHLCQLVCCNKLS